jgi:glycine cleavage system H lipoate-binding protein
MNSMSLKKGSVDKYPACIWMQAGVVPRKFCDADYNCPECRFDRVMSNTARENEILKQTGKALNGKKGQIIPWKDKLKSLPISKRPCVHHMKGKIEFRSCTNEYQCGNCDFDQYFQDQFSVHAVINNIDLMKIMGFKIPQGYYFHRGHTWAKIEGGSSVRVGLDDFALRLLGPLDSIIPPLMGKEVKQGRADISITRGQNRTGLLSPISGVVIDINNVLRERGTIANDEPYTAGWVMRVQSDSLRHEVKDLMIDKETEDFIEGQVKDLYRVIDETAGPMATDGGELGYDILGNMPQLGWDRMTRLFLHE